MALQDKMSFDLNANEERLRRLLLDVAAWRNSSCSTESLELRWAGGWVRDKLLGIESHDIDVAINCMTGEAFGETLGQFCSSPEAIAKYSMQAEDLGNLHTIKANPEKSKNLATATCRVFGVDLDFVNLRKETYADDSRNPQIEFGTPEEDARRRDATVNALFYNIHTGQVEDFTGGLSDLSARLIRTPLEPLQTFTDDPLRVLRLVRFASRLQFKIDPDTEIFMADGRVLASLAVKISRERVGVEMEKMLKGNHPRDSLAMVHRLGLYHVIFTDPTSNDVPVPMLTGWQVSYEILSYMARGENSQGAAVYSHLVGSSNDAYWAWVLAALTPWAPVETGPQPPGKPRKRVLPFATRVIQEGIRGPSRLCDMVTASHKNRAEMVRLKHAVCSEEDPQSRQRDYLAMSILRWEKVGGHWKLQLLYALLAEAVEEGATRQGIDQFLSGWAKFLAHLSDMDVMDATTVKRLVDGHALCKALGVKPGKWVAGALDICLAWQFRNPGVENTEAAIEEVRLRRDELKIPL